MGRCKVSSGSFQRGCITTRIPCPNLLSAGFLAPDEKMDCEPSPGLGLPPLSVIGLFLCWFAAFMLGVYLIGLSAILIIGMILLFLVTPPFAIWAFRN